MGAWVTAGVEARCVEVSGVLQVASAWHAFVGYFWGFKHIVMRPAQLVGSAVAGATGFGVS
jgi:hypothetical protein